jgi:hypothetical protein
MERFCAECETELVESSSDRGKWWCKECNEPRIRSSDIIKTSDNEPTSCLCCHENDQSEGGLCDECAEYGCYPDTADCPRLQEITDPNDCDHSVMACPYKGVSRCTRCGKEVPMESGANQGVAHPETSLIEPVDPDECDHKFLEYPSGLLCTRCGMEEEN